MVYLWWPWLKLSISLHNLALHTCQCSVCLKMVSSLKWNDCLALGKIITQKQIDTRTKKLNDTPVVEDHWKALCWQNPVVFMDNDKLSWLQLRQAEDGRVLCVSMRFAPNWRWGTVAHSKAVTQTSSVRKSCYWIYEHEVASGIVERCPCNKWRSTALPLNSILPSYICKQDQRI